MPPPRTLHLTIALILLALPHPASAAPIIPGATGFGIDTPAGRGGKVIHVTTLNDNGPGSLRAALAEKGPRVVIFDVSGTIELARNLIVREPFLTIAGQTAPSPGILLKGAGLFINTHDVLLQHLAIRPGDAAAGPNKENRDALDVNATEAGQTYNVVIDHVSCSWSTDEVFTTWGSNRGTVTDVTVCNSIFSEALVHAGHPKDNPQVEGGHGAGVLIGARSTRVSMYRNIIALNVFRNPVVGSGDAQVINNLIYRPGRWGGHKGLVWARETATRASIIGNVYILSPITTSSQGIRVSSGSQGITLFLHDNVVFRPQADNGRGAWFPTNGDDWSKETVELQNRRLEDVRLDADPFTAVGIPVLPSAQVEETLLPVAGARPADRDPVDTRLIRMIKERTGDFIDSPKDVGGYPELAVNRVMHDLPPAPNADDDADGYTNLEEWLHAKAAGVEGK